MNISCLLIIFLKVIFKLIAVKMLPFAFERAPTPSQSFVETQEELLSKMFLLALENQRLSTSIATLYERERSMMFQLEESKASKQVGVELELKKIEVDNLRLSLQESQQKLSVQTSKMQEQDQAFALFQKNSKREANEIKTQLQNYKNKYEAELARRNQYHRQEIELQSMKNEFKEKEQEKTALIDQLNHDLIYAASLKEQSLQEIEKSNKQLRREITTLREDLSRKEEECLNLRDALKDAPKMEELNRWIAKVKQYEEKQVQACGRVSQMGQDLCAAKEKYRRLEHEYRQLQKVRAELQQAVASNKDSEDSMTLYFDRLTTYQSVIKQLQLQLQRVQSKAKEQEDSYQRQSAMLLSKLKKKEQEKEGAIAQWQMISQEMNKQRTLLHAMQNQLDQYTKINQNAVINCSHQDVSTVQSRIMEKHERKSSSQRSGREEMIRYPTRESQLSDNSHVSQKIVFHSDRVSHSIDRLQTQQSDVLTKDSVCQDCDSRVKVQRCSSTDRVSNPYSYGYRNQLKVEQPLRERVSSSTVINDEKRMLMDKLNYIRPQQDSLKLTERSINSLYSKSFRQGVQPAQQLMKHSLRENPKSKLTIAKSKMNEQKENMNEMIMRRYQNLMGRP